jgi:Domain of unknown function (DUF4115)
LCIYFIFIISGLRWREHSQSPQRSTAVPVISAPSDLNSSATRVADKTAAVNKLPLRKQMGSAALRNPSELSTFTLSIRVRQDAWMSIIADGRRVLTETLVAPTETLVEAHRQIWIRAGNIGAVDFSFNGAGLPAQGAYDEARTLTFNANGLQTQLDSGTPANTPLSIAVGQSRR